MPHRSIPTGAVAVALLAAASSCKGGSAPCFNQSSLVLDPRVLAVRVDPPESIADLGGEDPLAPSAISALVVTGVLDQLFEYGRAVQLTALHTSVSICLPPTAAEVNVPPGCPAGSPVIAELSAVPDVGSPFVFAPPLALLQAAVDRDPLRGLAGVELLLQLSIDSGPAPLVATKALRYQLKGSLASVNHGLELTGMESSIGGAHRTYRQGEVVALTVAQITGLRPLIGPGPGGDAAIETYLAYDNSGHLVQLQEHITYSFYAGNALFFGSPSNGADAIYTGAPGDVADEPPPGSPDPPNGLVTVEPVYVGSQAGYFWVVARDGRGGVAWSPVIYAASDPRTCALPANQGGGHCPTLFFGCN